MAASLAAVADLSDTVLVVCPGAEDPCDSDDLGAALTRRAPHPVCHVLEGATGAAGTAELQMPPEHRGRPPRIARD